MHVQIVHLLIVLKLPKSKIAWVMGDNVSGWVMVMDVRKPF